MKQTTNHGENTDFHGESADAIRAGWRRVDLNEIQPAGAPERRSHKELSTPARRCYRTRACPCRGCLAWPGALKGVAEKPPPGGAWP